MASWFTESPTWTDAYLDLLFSEPTSEPVPHVALDEVLRKSSNFPVKFPISSVCCGQLKKKGSAAILERNINSAYPVLHEHALHLFASFLLYQRHHGDRKDFYRNVSLLQLVDRLLSKRAVCFVGAGDRYMILEGSRGGYGGWEDIGTVREKPPLTLNSCISYDEIRLSALLSVSSHTYFINDGNRNNRGIPELNLDRIEETGVIIGLIGTRLEKEEVMEYREIVKSPQQNTVEKGYGNPTTPTLQHQFLQFYGDRNATYADQVAQLKTDTERYAVLAEDIFFDRVMFERRIALSIDTLLIEANSRAKEEETRAYVHVVGIGLGVWKIYGGQNKLFTDTFAKRLQLLKDRLPNVSDVCFAYIGQPSIGPCKNGDKIGKITVHIENRDPHLKLKGPHQGKLLVVSYAWDGNALPGNEFWFGSLSGSGDPAAASSTQVAELHNYHIND